MFRKVSPCPPLTTERGVWSRLARPFSSALALFFFVVLMGCGDEPVDRCGDVTCDRGQCSPETGICENPARCEVDDACLEGFACNESARCVASWPCSESSDCARGICVQGACVSQTTCDVDEQCVEGDYCTRNGTCSPDLCFETTCERGVCQRATGACVSDGTCTPDTEQRSCIDGDYCYDFACISEAALCEEIGCSEGRGVCDPAAKTCVNATDCAGDDGKCLAGYFCDESVCRPNLCLENGADCSRGVCDPGTGDCVNAEQCANPARCLDGHYCVDGGCEEAFEACRRCDGNQLCDYDASAMTIACDENPVGCRDARDCVDDRVCLMGRCEAPSTCAADDFEPNDTSQSATNLNEMLATYQGPVEATLCSADADVYRFDTRGLGLIRGQLLVDVRYQREDIGIGELRVSVRNEAGDEVASAQTETRGFASIAMPVLAHQLGPFEIEVTAASDVAPQGVRYAVFADFLPTTVVAACDGAIELEPGTVESDSRRGNSSEIGSSCTQPINYAGEDVYRFEVSRASYVEIDVIPEPGGSVDMTMSLRQSCLSIYSEVACIDDRPEDGTERMGLVVDPGEYYLIVQGPSAGTGGPYTMNFSVEPVVCAPGQGRCVSANSAEVCNAQGTGFEVLSCDQGCSESRGHCNRTDGDACHVAIDATQGYTGSIFWPMFDADYDPGSTSCVPQNTNSYATAGSDVAYFVELPAGHAVEASLRMGQATGALYLVRDCARVEDTCVQGVNARAMNAGGVFDNTLVYHNGTNLPQRFYLIADNGAGLNVETAEIQITTGARVCEPGHGRCNNDTREVCNVSGTAYVTAQSCAFGCIDDTGTCAPSQNDLCKGAVDIVAVGGQFTNRIEEYQPSYDPGSSSCSLHALGGPDALFFVDLEEGQILDARLQSDFDGALWIMTDCSAPGASCVVSADRYTAQAEQIILITPATGRYFLAVDSRELSPQGPFTLTAQVLTPTCAPGENLGCVDADTVGYCSELGLPLEYDCTGGCSDGACSTRRGDSCVDALSLTAGQPVTGRFTGTNTINPGTGEVQGCFFEESGLGAETVYAIDLTQGQRLNVQVESETFFTVAYLMGSCSVSTSCLANSPTGMSHRLDYDAVADETVYIVVDRTLPSSSTSAFTLTASVQSPGCDVGSVQCIDGSTLGVCQSTGFYEPYLCTGACVDGRCTEARGDMCEDVVPLVAGQSVTGSWTGTNQFAAGPGLEGACDFGPDEALGPDTVYAVSLREGDVLEATLTTAATSSLLYLLEDCREATSCGSGPLRGSGTLYYRADADTDVFIVVDRNAAGSLTQTFTLEIDVRPSFCTDGEVFCSDDGTSLETCNVYGVSESYLCPNGCADGRCLDPSGQTCQEPIVLTSGEVVSGAFVGANTISLPAGDVGACSVASGGTPGVDTIYEIALSQGERLRALLDTSNTQAVLYLLGSCVDGTTCLAQSEGSADLSLAYTAEDDEVVYLVVDRTSSFSTNDTYELAIMVEPEGCSIGERACYGDGILATCNDDDYLLYLCEGGCLDDGCVVPRGDVCHDAIVLTSGAQVTGNWTGSNAINPGRDSIGACNFGTSEALGRDTIYAIDLEPGQVLEAELTTTMSGALLYLVSDCTSASETCLGNLSSSEGALFYQADAMERVFIVVDRTSTFTSTVQYTLKTTVHVPECIPGARQCEDGSTLSHCNAYGIWRSHPCSTGCLDGLCLDPDGDTCLEAIAVTTPAVVTGGWMGSNALNPGNGTVGVCDFGALSAVGRDTIYAVTMQPGQTLRAALDTNDGSAMLYVVEDCARAESCLANARETGRTTLYYTSDVFQTVYVVVDYRYSWTTTQTYSLDLSVQDGGCEVGTARCAADGQTLEICNDLGIYDFYSCDGTCSTDRCDSPTGDICLDAIALSSGDRVSGNWTGSNAIEPGTGQVGACAFGARNGVGRDTIYAVDLEPGDILDARVTTTTANAMIYLVEDCQDGGSCVAYARPHGTPRLSFAHEGAEPRRYYLVVDSSSTFSSTIAYDLEVYIGPALCTAGDQYCADDGLTLEVCTGVGILESHPCAGDCFGAACVSPAGDTCADAIFLSHGQEFIGSLSSYTNQINVGPGTCLYGTSSAEYLGRDAVFAVNLSEGDLLEVDLIPSSGQLSLFVLDTCFDTAENACVYGEADTRRVVFHAAESKTYYLVVDTSLSWSVPSFTLRVNVNYGIGVCQPGGSTCDDATGSLALCNESGTEVVTVATCAHGCDRDLCAGPPQPNSTCEEVETILGSVRLRDHLSRFENTFNPGLDSCIGVSTPGPDAVYRVPLGAGQVLRARGQIEGTTNDLALYILSDCADAEATCLDAARLRQGEGTAGYHATQATEVYVVVDTEFAGTLGHFILDIDIGPPDCEPGLSSYCDGDVFMECDRLGRYNAVPCPFGCGFDGCLGPPNDECIEALDASQGLGFTGEISAYSALYPAPSGCGAGTGAGPEAVFFVDVEPFDLINVVYRSDAYNTSLWFTADCTEEAASCVAGTSSGGFGQPEMLQYVADEGGRYFIFADSSSLTAQGAFEIDIWVEPPLCAVGEVTCINATTLGICGPQRNEFVGYSCQGGCSEASCGTPRGDICQDVIEASAGGTFQGDFAALTPQMSPSFGGCTGFDAPGSEAIYAVTLSQGQKLTATLSNVDEDVDLSLYVLTDCFDAARSCVAGSDVYGPGDETVIYLAPHEQTIFVVADSYDLNTTGRFEIVIAIE